MIARGSDDFVDKRQVAVMLGVSPRTIDRWVDESKIPYVRLPRRGRRTQVRFKLSSLEKWLNRKEIKPKEVKNDESNT